MNAFRFSTFVFAGALTFAASDLVAQPLTLEPAELERLGIGFVQPKAITGSANVALPARVTVPPTALSAIGAAFDAKIERLWKAAGEIVTAGEPLVRLRGPDLITLQGNFLQHSAALELKRSAYTRDHALADAGAIPARRLEETRAALHEARVGAAATRAHLIALGMTQDQVAVLAKTEHIQDSLELVALHDGYVLEKFVEVGQRVEAMSLIYRLARTEQLWLEARVPAERATEFSNSQQLIVDGTAEPAIIVYVGYAVDTADNTVTVRAEFEHAPATVRPGQFVMARWQGLAGTAYELPPTALVHDQGTDYVFVDTGAELLARPVSVVSRTGGQVRISDGLNGSERVVATGVAALKALWLSTRKDD